MEREGQAIESRPVSVQSASDFENLLHQLTGLDAELNEGVREAVDALTSSVGAASSDMNQVARRFFGRVNEKLDANRDAMRILYAAAAGDGYTFNYPQKKRIARAVDESDMVELTDALTSAGVSTEVAARLVSACVPVSWQETAVLVRAETTNPSKLRKAHQRKVEADVLAACAGPLTWALWPSEVLYEAFGGGGNGSTAREYMEYLESLTPALFNRERTLAVHFVDPSEDRVMQREVISELLASEYEELANHGFVAVVVDASSNSGHAWCLIHDAILFGERFREVPLEQQFFRRKEVAANTIERIPYLDESRANFDLLNEGFTYRDVFVLTGDSGNVVRLVLVMQKNMRDETRIPCPACRGLNIEGNSYPSFGVRSWECRNPLCPSRSIYDRGNRFQFRSVVQQAAIEDPRNTISVESVNRWRKDILTFRGDGDIAGTLIEHYSIADDGVAVLGLSSDEVLGETGRKVTARPAVPAPAADFWTGSFFQRFIVRPESASVVCRSLPSDFDVEILEGDSTWILSELPGDIFDRAVTSPPYYNAREYAQWSNLYCYLHDMYLNSLEVFRTLKPGAIYAYNIFDYFDNENVVTFSEMGRKRIPLGALMSHVFEEIGFEVCGVIPWDKGDIQGKRGFNGGNYSPYYQSPFNCWEHVVVLRKPSDEASAPGGLDPRILQSTARIAPVVKMVRGKNTYGHTAPFPEALPHLLLDGLPRGAMVLDPYAGSGTTALAGLERGLRTVLIERQSDYAELAHRRVIERKSAQSIEQSALF